MATEKRRRAPRGAQKSSVMNFRITPETKDLLKRAARASGRTASAECEHQLRRALSEMSPTLAYGILKAVRTAVETMLAIEHPQPERWTEEPELFDRVVRFLVGAMEMFRPLETARPPNAVAAPEEPRRHTEEGDKALGRASLLELLAQIARADSTRTARQSKQQRELVGMKEDLGELIYRPALHELVSLAERAIKDSEGLSDEDAQHMWSGFTRRISSWHELGLFDHRKAEGEKP
jgi:hypothetical protein